MSVPRPHAPTDLVPLRLDRRRRLHLVNYPIDAGSARNIAINTCLLPGLERATLRSADGCAITGPGSGRLSRAPNAPPDREPAKSVLYACLSHPGWAPSARYRRFRVRWRSLDGRCSVRHDALLRHDFELGYIPLDSVPSGWPIPPCVAETAGSRNRHHNFHRIWHWTIAGLKHPRLGFA
jgi:hypothetical protein